MLGSLLSETSIFSEVINFGIYLRTQFFEGHFTQVVLLDSL